MYVVLIIHLIVKLMHILPNAFREKVSADLTTVLEVGKF